MKKSQTFEGHKAEGEHFGNFELVLKEGWTTRVLASVNRRMSGGEKVARLCVFPCKYCLIQVWCEDVTSQKRLRTVTGLSEGVC